MKQGFLGSMSCFNSCLQPREKKWGWGGVFRLIKKLCKAVNVSCLKYKIVVLSEMETD